MRGTTSQILGVRSSPPSSAPRKRRLQSVATDTRVEQRDDPVGEAGTGGEKEVREPVPPPPIFVPHAEFNFGDGGYSTTKEGRRYHFDKDDNRWHYGRTHEERKREEEGREKMEHRK